MSGSKGVAAVTTYVKWYLIWKTMYIQPKGWKMKTEFADFKWSFLSGLFLALNR